MLKLAQRAIVQERRSARRFKVEWDVVVKGKNSAGLSFDEAGALVNLSARGAFLFITRQLNVGTKLDVWIKVPFHRERWMGYSAEVVRIEHPFPKTGIALKFSTTRPRFASGINLDSEPGSTT